MRQRFGQLSDTDLDAYRFACTQILGKQQGEREREGERGAINQQKDKQSKEGSDGMSAEPAVE